jgi:hypothetical protein
VCAVTLVSSGAASSLPRAAPVLARRAGARIAWRWGFDEEEH